jgi:hypothetical protein
MRPLRLLLSLLVLMAALALPQAQADVSKPLCSSYCAGRWCSGYPGSCYQLCNGVYRLLDCNQSCGAHC